MTESPCKIDLNLIQRWLSDAGQIALDGQEGVEARLKEDRSVVTAVDGQVAAFLEEKIAEHYPGHGILCEDGRVRKSQASDYLWVIDPLDGSRAYAAGYPFWGISVGLFCRSAPLIGLVSLPQLGELYRGGPDGAFYNNRSLWPASGMNLRNPVASLLVPSNTHQQYEIGFHRARSLGSTVAHLGYVARGVALGAITRRVYAWDIAGFLPILEQTGVSLVYLSGRRFELSDLLDGGPAPEPLIVAQAHLVEQVRTLFRPRIGDPSPASAVRTGHIETPARESS